MRKLSIIFVLSFFVFRCGQAFGDLVTDKLAKLGARLTEQFSVPVEHWRFHAPDVAGGEQPNFDDSAWAEVAPGYSWSGENSKVWFRTIITIPKMVAGQPVEGLPVRLDLGVDDDGELYVNGQLKEAFHWDDGRYTLLEHAQPGQVFHVAVRGINGPGQGQLRSARLYFDVLPEFGQYLDGAEFVGALAKHVPADERADLETALQASEREIQFSDITPDNLASVRAQLARAQAALLPAAKLTRKYDVYYVGHAHIDMNWLWPWPETIDVCHRTWNSAMNLMDEFPEFRFVQSQPGAYVAIEKKYPAEFARMQDMAKRGQWDPVGALWDESDSDLPSGEGLAESFLLGQRYFKDQFGKYAVTGWLPDSFGHSWQLPQIMQQAGIHYFYHMRCGDNINFCWWESPDGSRVLKANTGSYDENVELNQLERPAANDARFKLPQALVVFGVGDHGGGPTREQILRIKSFQADSILPRVHFASADEFFDQLSRLPAAASLPIIDTDLQYTFEGCYTSHGDIKKALRSNENNLYTAAVLSSLAAMMGQSYPVHGFDEAWKPVAFAQFHDIACGTAIHSTYDWIKKQLAPTERFEADQTDKNLKFLTENADTRGPGDQAIAVWNTLSFPRSDVVKVSLQNATQYHSVQDNEGHRFPAQVLDDHTLVFIAREVPAFGYKVYFPDARACPSDGITLRDSGDAYEIQTPQLTFQVAKASGSISRFYSQPAHWEVFGNAKDGDALQLLGDSGSAWEIRYTGQDKILESDGADVSVLNDGPVFVRLRVAHAWGKSSYTQDIVAYGALPRVDIPIKVNWQEKHELLKIRLPVNAGHPDVEAEIPFGSISRPVDGQECPGQKWMDMSQSQPAHVDHATLLNLAPYFNTRCSDNFDGTGNSYPAELLPAAGRQELGGNQVPFDLPGSQASRPDSIAAASQRIPLPDQRDGDSLYLLATCANGGRLTEIGFQLENGKTEFRAFNLNDWVVNKYADNQAGFTFAYRQTPGGHQESLPHMWIVQIPMPKFARVLVLPSDPEVHIFAATIASRAVAKSVYGLSVLNDCKYGFDVSSNVFRLTALRSASDPDPLPDTGMQDFTYSLYPHAGGWREAHADDQALSLNVPLLAQVTEPHAPQGAIPSVKLENIGGHGNLIVSSLKHSEDGDGYILRFYESDGQDTQARIQFNQPMTVTETDILERPSDRHALSIAGNSVTLPIGHNQIVSLRFSPHPMPSSSGAGS